jgi:hypothetical protein
MKMTAGKVDTLSIEAFEDELNSLDKSSPRVFSKEEDEALRLYYCDYAKRHALGKLSEVWLRVFGFKRNQSSLACRARRLGVSNPRG